MPNPESTENSTNARTYQHSTSFLGQSHGGQQYLSGLPGRIWRHETAASATTLTVNVAVTVLAAGVFRHETRGFGLPIFPRCLVNRAKTNSVFGILWAWNAWVDHVVQFASNFCSHAKFGFGSQLEMMGAHLDLLLDL